MRETAAKIDEGFVDQLIDQAEKGLDAIDHVLTEKDTAMTSLFGLIRNGSLNTSLGATRYSS